MVVAPIDSRAHRLLPGDGRAAPPGQQPEAILDAIENLADRHHPDVSRRQLDRQRDAVETPAEEAGFGHLALGQLEGGIGKARPVDEERQRLMVNYRSGDLLFPQINFKEPLRVEAEHFADCIRNNKEPKVPGEEGLKDMLAIEGIYQAAGAPIA